MRVRAVARRWGFTAILAAGACGDLEPVELGQEASALSGAAEARCAPPPEDDNVYEHYPVGRRYPVGTPEQWPWYTGWNRRDTENFDEFWDGRNLEQLPWLSVTSGHLYARHLRSSDGREYRRGYASRGTGTGVRILAGSYATENVMWTDMTVRYRAWVDNWHPASDEYRPGLSVFARYRSEHDLYVASYKRNGRVLIQRKLCGKYRQIGATQWLDPIPVRRWIGLGFTVADNDDGTNRLTLAVTYRNDEGRTVNHEHSVIDAEVVASSALSSGTHGIRLDYGDFYIDAWSLAVP